MVIFRSLIHLELDPIFAALVGQPNGVASLDGNGDVPISQLGNVPPGVTDHGLLTGLADDDHLQYFYSTGRLGGQSAIGGTNPGDNLDLIASVGGGSILFKTDSSTERARILSTGQILVGAIAPFTGERLLLSHDDPLNGTEGHVRNSAVGVSASAQWGAANDAGNRSQIGITGTAYTPVENIQPNEAFIRANLTSLVITTGPSHPLRFQTGFTERARILATGELLINTTTTVAANELLFIRKDFNDIVSSRIHNGSATASAMSRAIYSTNNGNIQIGSVPNTYTSTPVIFTGGVGFVRTEGPTNGLVLSATHSGPNPTIRFAIQDIEEARFTGGGEFLVGSTTQIGTELGLFLRDQDAATILLVKNNTLGSSAQAVVQIGNNLSDAGLAATSSGFAPSGSLIANEWYLTSGGTGSLMLRTPSTGVIRFTTNDTERARFLSTGEFLINTTTLVGTEKLNVTGDVYISGKLTVVGAIDPTSIILSGGTAQYMEWGSGSTASVAGLGKGRIRFNESTNTFEISENGGGWGDLSVGSNAFMQDGNAFGGLATLGTTDGNDLRIITNNNESARFVNGATTINRYLAIGGTTRVSASSKIHVEDSTSSCFIEVESNVGSGSAGFQAYNVNNDQLLAYSTGSGPTFGLQARSIAYTGTPGTGGAFGVGPTNDVILYFIRNNAPRGWCDTSNNWVFGNGTTNPQFTLTAGTNGPTTLGAHAGLTGGTSAAYVIARAVDSSHDVQMYATTPGFTTVGLVTANDAVIQADSALDQLLILHDGAKPIVFGTNGSERVRILSTGEVGIGTNTPGTNLHVKAPATGNASVAVQGTGAGNGGTISFSDGGGASSGGLGHSGPALGVGSDLALFSAAGKDIYVNAAVGRSIFLTSAGTTVAEIKPTATGNSVLAIRGFLAGSGGSVQFTDGLTTLIGGIGHTGPLVGVGSDFVVFSGSGKVLRFHTDGPAAANERMRILTTGVVRVGSTDASFGGDFQIRRDQSTFTFATIENQDTAGLAGWYAVSETGGATISARLETRGSTAATSGSRIASQVVVASSGAATNGLWLGTINSAPLILATGDILRARILSSGEFLINTSTLVGTEKLNVNGDVYISGKLTVVGAIDPTSVTLSGGTAQYMEWGAGSTATAAGVGKGRIRFNESTNSFEVSENGGGWADLSVGGNTFVQDGNSFGGLATLGTNDSNALAFETNGSERARILSTGEVCIGTTTSFGGRLNIQTTTTNDNTLGVIRGNGTGFGGAWTFQDGNATPSGAIGHSGPVLGSGSDMAIVASGTKNLLLNTSTTSTVRVQAAGETGLLIRPTSGSAATGGYISFYDGTQVRVGIIGHSGPVTGVGSDLAIQADTGKALVFFTNGATERARINSTGQLLYGRTTAVGSSSDVANFEKSQNGITRFIVFNQTSDTTAQAIIRVAASLTGATGAGTPAIDMAAHSTGFTSAGFQQAGSVGIWGSPNTSTSMFINCASSAPLLFGTNNTERTRILATGEFLVGLSTTFSGALAAFERNASSATGVFVRNIDAGTTAQAAFAVNTGSGKWATLGRTGAGWTPTGGRNADEAFLEASGGPLMIQTDSAQPIRFNISTTECFRITTASAFLFGGGGYTAPFAGEQLGYRKDHNGNTRVNVINTTDGTAANIMFAIMNGAAVDGYLVAYSPSYTTAGNDIAGEVQLQANGGSITGMSIRNISNTPLKFYTNDLERAIILGTGEVGIGTSTPDFDFDVAGNKRVGLGAPNTAPTDSDIDNSQITHWLDESGNTLTFRVRYSDGTLKTGTVTLT